MLTLNRACFVRFMASSALVGMPQIITRESAQMRWALLSVGYGGLQHAGLRALIGDMLSE